MDRLELVPGHLEWILADEEGFPKRLQKCIVLAAHSLLV
jgi:hypothetical protein